VGEIQARLDIPGSTLSHHLSELTQAGLLKATRQGTTIRYAARFDHLRALTDYLWEDCCGGGCRDPQCVNKETP
jgi:DNA-binding transcriptional ArsR family regulator